MQLNKVDKTNKSLSQLKKELTKVFNAFIRKRDLLAGDMFKCISCGKIKSKEQLNAGHYYSAGNHSSLRWHEDNVHGQCIQCNNYLHGNLLNYRKNLIDKIGLERVEKLDNAKHNANKMGKFEVVYLMGIYKRKLETIDSDISGNKLCSHEQSNKFME